MEIAEVLRSIEREAPSKGLPIIGSKRGEFLDRIVKEHAPSRILEVGTLVGYSAIRMARHFGPAQKLTCVEVSGDMAKTARTNIQKAGLQDKVEVLVGDAKAVIPTLKGNYDMVFLDAAKDEYLTYLKLCEKLIGKGSLVVADNVKSFSEVLAPYLDYVRNSGKYSSTYHESEPNPGQDDGDAIEVSVKL